MQRKEVCDHMGNHVVSEEDKKNLPLGLVLKITGQLAESLFTAVVVVMCVVLAFYAKDGYHQIGEAKFIAYRNVMMIGCSVLTIVTAVDTIHALKVHKKYTMSVNDGCVLAYLVLSWVAAMSGGFHEDALWGFYGWRMGLMSQLSFVLLYLFASRFGKYYRLIIAALLAVACVVYGIGILHRLLVDPIGFYDGLTNWDKTLFLSTLGQSSWYGSFLAVTLPVGMGVFLYSDKEMWTILGGIFMAIGFCTLVTQNSDSVYFGFAGALIIFFVISARERKMMCRFMGALTLFFVSGKIMCFLMQIHPNPEFKPDLVTKLMWTSKVTWLLLVVCLSATIILYAVGKKAESRQYPIEMMRRVSRAVPIAAIAAVACVIPIIILQTRGALPKVISDRLASISYFNWNSEWGNGRGRIWQFSVKIFLESNVWHKLFGVGPDCFQSYVAARYSEEAAYFWGNMRLPNAHNEWATSLVNVGIVGTAAYLGIYVTAIRKFIRGHHQNILLAGIAAACISYMCCNFFCYQQVLCTPFVFLLMGLGEYILRESGEFGQLVVDKTQSSV